MSKPQENVKKLLSRDLKRSFDLVGNPDSEKRTVDVAFSSDVRLERLPGLIEQLSHDKGACDLSRLQNGAPLLWNHDTDKVIGVIENARIDSDGVGRATVRFSRNAFAEEKWRDVQDGILRKMSVGYRVKNVENPKTVECENGIADLYLVRLWEPYEISLVSVPADDSVGVGRAFDNNLNLTRNIMTRDQIVELLKERGISVPTDATEEQLRKMLSEALATRASEPATAHPSAPAVPAIDADTLRSAGMSAERERVQNIRDIGRAYHYETDAEDASSGGMSVADFRKLVKDKEGTRNQAIANASSPLGLSDKERKRFSFLRMISTMVDPNDKNVQAEAAFELECSRAQRDRVSKYKASTAMRGQCFVPPDMLTQPNFVYGQRAADTMGVYGTAGTGVNNSGAKLVETTLLTGSFIELLRKRTVLMQLGTQLSGLVGYVSIPKQISTGQVFWVGEGENVGKSDFAFDVVTLKPKTVGTFIDLTRQMLKQPSMDMEALARRDIIANMAVGIDKAGFYADGSGAQPTGLKYQNGINSTKFASAGKPTYAELVGMESTIASDNADLGNMAYISNTNFRGYAKTALKFDGIAGTIWEQGGSVNGYRTEITNQIETGDVIFGNFGDLLVGLWSGLELAVDPYTNILNGGVRIVVMQDTDIAVRRPESFCWGAAA